VRDGKLGDQKKEREINARLGPCVSPSEIDNSNVPETTYFAGAHVRQRLRRLVKSHHGPVRSPSVTRSL